MWGLDGETLLKLGILAMFLLFGLLKLILETFAKAAGRERGEGQTPGRPALPPRELRDFLSDIRGEGAPMASAPPEPALLEPDSEEGRRRPEPKPPEDLVVWEESDEELETTPPPAPRPTLPPPAPRPGANRQSATRQSDNRQMAGSETPARRGAVRGPGSVRDHLETMDRNEATNLTRRRLEITVERRIAEAQTGPRKFSAMGWKASGVFPRGLNLRDGILTQIILGPPRCRRRSPIPERASRPEGLGPHDPPRLAPSGVDRQGHGR